MFMEEIGIILHRFVSNLFKATNHNIKLMKR